MTTFLAYLGRLITIIIGFALASIAASVFFVLVGVMPESGGLDGTGFDLALNFLATLLLISVAVASFSSIMLLVPVFVFVMLSEYFSWNGLLFHGAAGAFLGGSVTTLWLASRAVEGESHLILVATAAGIIGACAYWLVAGRNAGKLIEQIVAARQQ